MRATAIRATVIPKIIFEEIKKFPEVKLHNFNLENGPLLQLLFLKASEAVVGLMEVESPIGSGTVSFLKVWNYRFPPNFNIKNFSEHIYDTPVFEIIGGPLLGTEWVLGQGFAIVEEVVIRYNGDKNLHSVEIWLGSPFSKFKVQIESIAEMIQDEKQPPKIKYWQALKHPNADYSKPP